ncbi:MULTISPECIES: response regulator transcription factor [unclassified Flavobacterium]|uniref:response regulator transcription factor n=1 Tax=unclassified Flavobacterium TaxID=196869 RepID=UPI0009607C3A|nr:MULTISPECIES: response regulator transcription factor [unclassified Flavobacterium]MBN9284941.1 response regulator transcription factor [Flavobacterium sp.]OJV72252.1 MAG: two-component system response regulator [Flavobacterium sp. 40-81]
MDAIRIAITDDDGLIVKLLESYLSTQKGFEVIFTAESGDDLIAFLESASVLPDVLLLDLKMKGMDGVEVTRHLKTNFSSIKVIIVSSHYQRSFMNFMLKTGASAFLPKGVSPTLLTEIIPVVHEKGVFFMEDQMEAIREQIATKSTQKSIFDNGSELSKREIEVLQLISQQKTAKEIGDTLFITARTVEGHKNNLFVKTGAKNIAGLVIYAIQNNYITVEDLPMI